MTTQSRYSADSIMKACKLVVQEFSYAIECATDGAWDDSRKDDLTTFDQYFWPSLRAMLELYREEKLHVAVEDNPAALAVWDAIFKREPQHASKSKVAKSKKKGR